MLNGFYLVSGAPFSNHQRGFGLVAELLEKIRFRDSGSLAHHADIGAGSRDEQMEGTVIP
jgi:hypothetical protein